MNERAWAWAPRVDLESLFDERQRVLQSPLLIKMDGTEDVTTIDAITHLSFKVQPDPRMDDIVHTVSAGSQRIGSQAQELSIAS